MSTATLSPKTEASKRQPPTECRVYERQASALAIQCQPVAARGDKDIVWTAVVRNISPGGVALVLERRFEPRTGLAIELPEADGTTFTVFVRVVRAQSQPGGRWLLGCTFVTPLTEERVRSLLPSAPTKPAQSPEAVPAPAAAAAPLRTKNKSIISGVHFQANLGDGKVVSRRVTNLHVSGQWPLRAGRIMKVWLGKGPANGAAVNVRVERCYPQRGNWIVDCTFVQSPPLNLLRKLDRLMGQ